MAAFKITFYHFLKLFDEVPYHAPVAHTDVLSRRIQWEYLVTPWH